MLAREQAAALGTLEPYRAFAARVAEHRGALRRFLRDARAAGRTICGYGASTKGNVVLQYCGVTADDLPCIAEVNEDKFGAFTPGTRIPIVPEAEVRARRPDYLLVLPWHFRDVIVERERAYLEAGGRLVFPLPAIEVVGAAGAAGVGR
jgi:NDP-4-keto-2,6-dideoxyhexose 3-C-methyltransferase